MKPIRAVLSKDILKEVEKHSTSKLERLIARYLRIKINKLNKDESDN